MANQDDQPNENEEVVEDQTQDEAPQEEVQEEVQEEEQPLEDEQVEEPQEEIPVEEPQPSRREQLRIQDLLKKYGPPQERAPQNNGIDYQSMIEADEPVYQQLNQASQEYGNRQYQEGLKQASAIQFNTRLEVDAPKVASKFPQLDKDSDEFNPAVANSLNEMYLSSVGYNADDGSVRNPNLRYSDYIEAMYELVDEAANRKVETTQRNVTKQVARTGLRPDGSSATTRLDLTKAPQDMTDAELDAALAKQGLGPKKR